MDLWHQMCNLNCEVLRNIRPPPFLSVKSHTHFLSEILRAVQCFDRMLRFHSFYNTIYCLLYYSITIYNYFYVYNNKSLIICLHWIYFQATIVLHANELRIYFGYIWCIFWQNNDESIAQYQYSNPFIFSKSEKPTLKYKTKDPCAGRYTNYIYLLIE